MKGWAATPLSQNLIESRRFVRTSTALTIVQSGPHPDHLDGLLVSFQVVVVWLLLFGPVGDFEDRPGQLPAAR